MAERIELISTPEGGEHTKSTNDMKTDAWKIAEELGVKDEAKMSYSPKSGVYAMTLSDNVAPEKVAEFTERTASYRTDEARAELAAALPGVKEASAASREEKASAPEKAPVEKAPKEPKEPQLPRSDVALYPLPVEPAEGQDPRKAASSAMAKVAEGVIEELGLKDSVKFSYDMQNSHFRVGGRGLSEDNVKALQDGLADYRTPEAEAAWKSNAPVKDAAAKDTGAKGPVEAEGPDLSGAAKGAGAER